MSENTRVAAFDYYQHYLNSQAESCGSYTVEEELSLTETRHKIKLLVIQFLYTCLPQERFRYAEFQNLIIQSSAMEFFDPIKAAESFGNLEKYIILLCIMPWKLEFHQIKKYGGFYQTKIEAHLRNADTILKLIGFNEITAGLLTFTPGSNNMLPYIAFECLVAAEECRILETISSNPFEKEISISKIVQVRQTTSGSPEVVIRVIEGKYGKSVIKTTGIAENVIDARRSFQTDEKRNSPGFASTEPFRSKLQNYMQTAKKLSTDPGDDIPYIDEGVGVKDSNYTPINLDEQILASLKMVEGKDNKTVINHENLSQCLKPSQEWNFVREGLEKNYGKQYFEGPRGDLLENQLPERHNMGVNEPAYVKLYAQKQDPGYVNSETANQFKKDFKVQHQQEFSPSSQAFSESKDSAYGTYGTVSTSAMYPPSFNEQMRRRGNAPQGQVTDTVLTKSTGISPVSTGLYAKTEPVLRKSTVDESNAQRQYNTQPYYRAPVYANATPVAAENMDNIQKYKRSSAPSAPARPMPDPVQYLPVVNTGLKNVPVSRSYTETTQRNTTDSSRMSSSVNIPPVKSNGAFAKTNWSCPHCTYFNENKLDVCEMCSKSRDSQTEMDSPPLAGHSSRICEQCTLENERNSVTCHACGHHLNNGLQTVI